MAHMDDKALLNQLQALEDDSSDFTWGVLGQQRERGMREYFRAPYGTEQEGLSSIVTSEVQDTVEWILPELLDIFVSTNQAVVFEPAEEADVESAEQATDAVNHVFHKQNNGFLILYTAFKDALMVKNCAVMWRKETKRTRVVVPVAGATAEMLAMILQEGGKDAKIESSTPKPPQPMLDEMGQPMLDMMGQPMNGPEMFDARVSRMEEKTTIKVEAFPPEDLLIKRDWTSPLLADCPYVCRTMRVTLSELHEMGYTDVKAEDLASSDEAGISGDSSYRMNRTGATDEYQTDQAEFSSEDESMTQGFLRIEFVLIDYDGDGISERRCIYRLKDKILKNEETSHVPIATASPILVQHRWDGMSIAECVSDLQLLSTELTQQMIDSGRLALNPRTKVLVDASGAPQANIDDLLDSRAGGLVRQNRVDATQEMITPWVGGQMFPMLEYKDRMLEKRTGVSANSQGLDPNSINRGGAYETKVMNAAKMRVKLIARIFSEILLKPVFAGILKTLTDGDMEKLSFRLRNKFVQYDPNEWRDQYDMTSNIGLGTGDKDQQTLVLQQIAQTQSVIAQSPYAALLLKPKNIYNVQSRLVENAGFKNVGDFFQDPGDQPTPPPQTPPDPAMQVKQMELQADAQKFQAETQQSMQLEQMKAQAKLQEVRANLELQASNDQRDGEREAMKAMHAQEIARMNMELQRYKVDQDNATKIVVAQIGAQPNEGEQAQEPAADPMAAIAQAIAMLAESQARPKTIMRGPDGLVSGVM